MFQHANTLKRRKTTFLLGFLLSALQQNKKLSQCRWAALDSLLWSAVGRNACFDSPPLGASLCEGWDKNHPEQQWERPHGEEKGEIHYLIPLQQNSRSGETTKVQEEERVSRRKLVLEGKHKARAGRF